MISKSLLDRIRKIPGEWFLNGTHIRHRQIDAEEEPHACPLVALLWHEEERPWRNDTADDIVFGDDIDCDHDAVMHAADDDAFMFADEEKRFRISDDRKLLLDACRIKG